MNGNIKFIYDILLIQKYKIICKLSREIITYGYYGFIRKSKNSRIYIRKGKDRAEMSNHFIYKFVNLNVFGKILGKLDYFWHTR